MGLEPMACKGFGGRVPVPPQNEVLIKGIFICPAQFQKIEFCAVNFTNAFGKEIAEVVAELV